MFPRAVLLTVLMLVTGCVAPSPHKGLAISVDSNSGTIRLFLDWDTYRQMLSDYGVPDFGSTTPTEWSSRHKIAAKEYAAGALRQRGICPHGVSDPWIGQSTNPFNFIIAVQCVSAPMGLTGR